MCHLRATYGGFLSSFSQESGGDSVGADLMWGVKLIGGGSVINGATPSSFYNAVQTAS